MKRKCRSCKIDLNATPEHQSPFPVTGGMCRACTRVLTSGSSIELARFLESLDAPVLLMQPEPRLVHLANQQALELFGKDMTQVAGHRGGQVFECIHAFTEAGCGKDVHCSDCKIKNAVVETFMTGKSFNWLATELEIRTNSGTVTHLVRVSTEKLANWALLGINQFEKRAFTKG